MGLNLFVVNKDENEVSDKIKFDTDKYHQDYDFLHHVCDNCTYLEVKRFWGDDNPTPMRIRDFDLARKWINENIEAEGNKERLIELINNMEKDDDIYLSFSN